MNMRSSSLFSGSKLAALALAAGLMTLGATSADAQWFRWPRWDAALPAVEVERLLEESGYRLTGPVYRNGPVYVANVLGRGADAERLIIDAHDGRLLQRYALAPARRAAVVAGDWASPRARVSPDDDAWLDNDDDANAPRPPAALYGESSSASLHLPPPDPAPPLHAPQTDQVARADNSASSPYVILAPPAAPHEPALEKPRPKPQARHRKPEPTPVASPAAAPASIDAKATPGAPAAAATPAAPAQPQADAAAAAASRVADTKAAPAPEVIAPAPAAPPPKAAKPNDVPVAPLE